MKSCLALLLLLLMPCQGYAATYYLDPANGSDSRTGVNPTNSPAGTGPWKTMHKIKTTVVAGDTVNILAGTYTPAQYQGESGTPEWNEAQSHGTSGAPITVQANPGDTVIFDGEGAKTFWMNFNQRSGSAGFYVVIKNLTFQNYVAAVMSVGGTPRGHHLAIVGCTFNNTGMLQSAPLGTGAAQYVIFKDNMINRAGDPNIAGDGSANNQHAFYIGENSQFIVLDGNKTNQTSGYAVHVFGHADYTTTINNLIIRKNILVNTLSYAMLLTRTNFDKIYIFNNTMYNDQVPFADVALSSGGGMFRASTSLGTYAGVVIKNNVGYGYMTDALVTGQTTFTSSSHAFDYNMWGNLTNSVRVYDWDGTFLTLAGFRSATGYDLNALGGNPLFTNTAARDFSLQTGSPAIDSGTSLTTAVGSGSSSTSLTVADAGYFHDGYGLITGDTIVIGAAMPVTISSINYSTNVMTLASARSWSNGAAVSLPYTGAAPDMGAIESGAPVGELATFYADDTGSQFNCATAKTAGTPYTVTTTAQLAAFFACGLGGSTFEFKAGTYPYLQTSASSIPAGNSAIAPTTVKANAGATVIFPAIWLDQGFPRNRYIVFDGLTLDVSLDSGSGLTIWPNGGGDVIFKNGEIKNGTSENVYLQNAANVQLLNNLIHDQGSGTSGILAINTTGLTIKGNTVYNGAGAAGHGIRLTSGSNSAIVEQNRVRNNAGVGIVTNGVTSPRIANNLIYSNSLRGVDVQTGSSGVLVYNNTFWSNTGAPIQIDSGASTTEHKNNIYYQNGNSDAVVNNGTGTVALTNFAGNPSFTSPGPPTNFHVGSASVIDQGTTLAAVTVDFFGNGRTVPYTIGAAEETAPEPPPAPPVVTIRMLPFSSSGFLTQ